MDLHEERQRRVTTQIACCVHFSHSALRVSGRVTHYVPSSQRGRNKRGEKVIKQK